MQTPATMLHYSFALLLSLCAFCASALEAVTLIASESGAPKHYADRQGQPNGYAVEIAEEAIERAGLQVNTITRPWKRAQREAKLGKGIITGFSKTTERQAFYLFSSPIFDDRVILVQKKNKNFPFNALADLKGKKIGIKRGSYYSGDFNRIRSELSLDEDSSNKQRLQKLLGGRLDAAIFSGDIYTIFFHAQAIKADINDLTISEKPISQEANYLGIPKNLGSHNPEVLKAKLDSAIEAMHADGTIQKIRDRYIAQ